MSFQVEIEHILATFKILKSYAYYENLNLFLKRRIAEFETTHIHNTIQRAATNEAPLAETSIVNKIKEFLSSSPDQRLSRLISLLNSEAPENHPFFDALLEEIDFKIIPKKVSISQETQEKNGPLFLTNKKTSDSYNIEKFNYLIDAPSEIHIIEMMWSAICGPTIDGEINSNSYGNRISDEIKFFRRNFYNNEISESSQCEIFKRYIERYSKWRDGAIDSAKSSIENGKNSAIFSIDLKSYFYSTEIDFDEIRNHLSQNKGDNYFEIKLTNLLEKIFIYYHNKIYPFLQLTHPDESQTLGLPIGFASSSILANWHLRKFDNHISNNIRPAYYGRYVDDLIFVFSDPNINTSKNGNEVDSFIKNHFKQTLQRKGNLYLLDKKFHGLILQRDKIILHYFDKNHTLASLDLFEKEIEERSSAFRFLPDDHIEADMEKFSYDLLYAGSANKFRSLVGLAENETNLSKYLSSHIIAHRLCKISAKHDPIPKIQKFFKGENAIKFFRLWEKVISYALIKDGQARIHFAREFREEISRLIKLTVGLDYAGKESASLTEKSRIDLHEYLNISTFLPLSLLDKKNSESVIFSKNSPEWIFNYSNIVHSLRQSNMFRHAYVAWPLFNYTDYEGELCDSGVTDTHTTPKISELKTLLTPRFIHFDEWQVFQAYVNLQKTSSNPFYSFAFDALEQYKTQNSNSKIQVLINQVDRGDGRPSFHKIDINDNRSSRNNKRELKIAIANLKIPVEDIERAFRKDREPNVSYERQQTLWKILNEAELQGVELLVLPEVSVPVSWLPFMISHARRHQIALIFGLEHWVCGNKAYNLLVEAFPFRTTGQYKSCLVNMRVKNHYAPEEKRTLEKFRLLPAEPQTDNYFYNLVNWNGIQLSSYNCFELANIEHRSLFKSELDLLIACVWNRDTSYYAHILQSATRDLFCYVVQSNTSQYGGSCVLKPSRTIESEIIKVKGGDNGCILTTKLDISGLRDSQHKSTRGPEDSAFKATPPGYDHERVLKR
ncbi:RNA-directed DNA polymerase [Thalassospira sp. HF15]|uniref:RNA-directed DNA polymerase n=1 Tax=Thalassospira sp. HF15 TaxID=2722755 RepID=UPI001C379411|nr:RNA-directed DNA polymerase [Thalassospira sp. HF15]